MGRVIKPSEIQNQVESIKIAIEKNKTVLTEAYAVIHSFMEENALQGVTWSGMKDQMAAHDAVIRGLMCMIDELVAKGMNLVSECGVEELDEDLLEAQLASLRNEMSVYQGHIDQYASLMQNESYIPAYRQAAAAEVQKYQSLMNNTNETIQIANQKLDEIDRIDSATRDLMATVEVIKAETDQGMLYLSSSWNGTGFTPAMGRNLSWMSALKNAVVESTTSVYFELRKMGMTSEEIQYLGAMGVELTKDDLEEIKKTIGNEKIMVSVDGKALFFGGKVYPIYVPTGQAIEGEWKVDYSKILVDKDFDAAAGLVGMVGSLKGVTKDKISTSDNRHVVVSPSISSSDKNVSGAAILSLLTGVENFLSSGFSESDVYFTFSSSEAGSRRVTIMAGTLAEREFYQGINYNVSMTTYKKAEDGAAQIKSSIYAKDFYKVLTGMEVPDKSKTYTLSLELDEAHETDTAFGYLSYDNSGELIYTPKIYGKDKAYISTCGSMTGIPKENVYDFSDALSTPTYANEKYRAIFEQAMKGES